MTKLPEQSRLTDQVFKSIRDAIMSGEIPAGTRLRIRELADRLGTSPMPVRDAIIRLEQTGLARHEAHKGAIVTDLSPAELIHVYATRLLLETEATRIGSRSLGPADGERMRVVQQQMMTAVAARRGADALDHDEALLTILYAAAGNPVLLELIRSLWQRCRPYKLIGVRSALQAGDLAIWSFQDRLIEATVDGDWRSAVAITQESLQHAMTRITEELQKA